MRIILNNGKYVNKVASTALSLLLDSLSGSAGAFSLRKLNSSYSGNAIQVRRSSDNTTLNIGFITNELDTASLNTFCSGTNGFVTIWYDQSGNSNNLIQSTAVKQFEIVNSGSIHTVNGKAALLGNESFLTNSTKTASSTTTMFLVHKGNSNTTASAVAGFPVGSSQFIGLYYWGQDSGKYFGFNVWNNDSFGFNNSTSEFDSQSLWTALFKDGNIVANGSKLFKNGTQKAISQVRGDSTVSRNVTDGIYIGRGGQVNNNQESNGYYQEVILWDADYSSTNRTTIETKINTYYSLYGLLLDSLSGSTGGFSLRKLKSSYSGNAIQVRRASDNATQDIGFVNNQLDTTSLNTFCSGTNGFVTIWYNQSDTSNNAIQTTAANQPKIYDSSTGVELENGKPAINFVKANSNWLEVADNTFGNIEDAISNFSVFKVNTGTTSHPVIFSKSYNSDGSIAFNLNTDGTRLDMWIDTIKSFNGVGSDIRGSQVLFNNINLLGSNGLKLYIDSALISQQTTSQNLTGTNSYKFTIGRNDQDDSYYMDGTIQEIILFSNDQTSNRTTIESNINTNYTIY